MISTQTMRCLELISALKARQDTDPETWAALLTSVVIALGTPGPAAAPEELLRQLRAELAEVWRGGTPPVLSEAAEDRLRDRKKAAVEMLWRAAREDRELAVDEVLTLFFLLEEIVAENAKGDIVQEIGQDFYHLTIKERDYARVQVANREASLGRFRSSLESVRETMADVVEREQETRRRLEALIEGVMASAPEREDKSDLTAVIDYVRSLEIEIARLQGHRARAEEARRA